MTFLKSVALCLSLQILSRGQLAAAQQYNYDGLPAASHPPDAKPPPDYSSFDGGKPESKYTSTGHIQPHSTEPATGGDYYYQYSFSSRPVETRSSYFHSSIASAHESASVVILAPSETGSSSAQSYRASHVSVVPAPTSTPVEVVRPVSLPLSRNSSWLTKRAVPKASTTVGSKTPPKTTSTQKDSKPSAPTSCPSGKFYTVVSGDTCVGIANKEKVPVGKLITSNKLPSTCNTLQIGQKLCVPKCTPYTVQPNDFCFKITQKFNIELADLYAENP